MIGSLVRRTWVAALAPALVGVGCGNPSEPQPQTQAHPAGVLAMTRNLGFRPYGVAVSAQGLAYVTRLDTAALTAANLGTMQLGAAVHVGSVPTDVQFSPSGATAYVTNQLDGTLGIVNVGSGIQTTTVPLGGDPFDVLPSADGARVYVSTNANKVMVVNAATHGVIDSIATGLGPQRLAFNPTGSRLYVAEILAGVVQEINPATSQVTRTFPVGGVPQGMAVSPDGTELYIANGAGRVDIWQLVADTLVTSIPVPGAGFGLAMTKDATQLYVCATTAGRVVIIDRQARTIVDSVMTGGDPRRVAFSPDGLTAIVSDQNGAVHFIR